MTAEESKEGFPPAKPRWGCGCVFMLIAALAGAYWFIMWISTQTS